jgi:outer membrane receptor protein involved in Fe transport
MRNKVFSGGWSALWGCLAALGVLIVAPGVVRGNGSGSGPVKKSHSLGDVVVKATRSGTALEDLTGSVSIVTREEIEASPYNKVEDILRSVAGVDVGLNQYVNTLAGIRPVNIRGVGGYGARTLVLIDGIPQNNANNGWVDLSQVPLEWIDRIEVMRGPFSALYGSNSMGGLINIITKNPTLKRETTVKTKYGTLSSWDSLFTHRQKFRKVGVVIGGRYFETDGYIPFKPEYPNATKTSKDEKNFFLKAIYDVNDVSDVTFGLTGLYSDQNRGREYFEGTTNNWHPYVKYRIKNAAYDFTTSFYYNIDEWDVDFDRPPTYSFKNHSENVSMDAVGMQNQLKMKINDWNILTFGLDLKSNKLNLEHTYYTMTRDVGSGGKEFGTALFFQDEMSLIQKKLLINLGARVDYIHNYDGRAHDTASSSNVKYDSQDWTGVSPKLGAAYRLLDSTTLKGSFGTSFKAPSLYELYTSLTRGRIYIEANPELEPENVISYDLGIEHWFLSNLMGSLTYYQSFAEDYIDYNLISDTYWVRDNIGKVDIQGLELELHYYFMSYMKAQLSYTYNESKIKEYGNAPEVVGNYLALTPRNKVGFSIFHNRPEWFDAGVTVVYNSKRWSDNTNNYEVPGYTTVDFKISKSIKNFTLGLEIENLFDKEYYLSRSSTGDTEAPGRMIFGSVAFTF